MSPEKYKQYQDFQNKLFFFTDSHFIADEAFGNILFTQMSNAAFEVFSKFEIEEPACPHCELEND